MTTAHRRIVDRRVISLKHSSRRESFFARGAAQRFRVFDAVDGSAGEGDREFDRSAFQRRYGRQPSPGEVGCAVSHLRVLREFVETHGAESDVLVVAEDDALLIDGFDEIVDRIITQVSRIGIVVLACPFGRAGQVGTGARAELRWQLSVFSRIIGRSGRHVFRVGHAAGSSWGAGLYLISRDSAERFVRHATDSGGVSWLADHHDLFASVMGIDIKRVRPNIADWVDDADAVHAGQANKNSEYGLGEDPTQWPTCAYRLKKIARASLSDAENSLNWLTSVRGREEQKMLGERGERIRRERVPLHPRIVSCKVLALEGSERLPGFFERPGSEHFEVFRAVDGRKGEGEELFDRRAFHVRYGREARAGEVGCAVSHYRIMHQFGEKAGRDSDLLLVAEDDARLSPRAILIINRIARYFRRIDLGVLSGVTGSMDRAHIADMGMHMAQMSLFSRPLGWSGSSIYRFGRVEGGPRCTGFYLVSRAAARRYVDLVKLHARISWVADEYGIVVERAGGKVRLLRPDIAKWEGATTIGEELPAPFDPRGLGVLASFKSNLAFRTRLRLLRGSVAATLREVADAITPKRW